MANGNTQLNDLVNDFVTDYANERFEFKCTNTDFYRSFCTECDKCKHTDKYGLVIPNQIGEPCCHCGDILSPRKADQCPYLKVIPK